MNNYTQKHDVIERHRRFLRLVDAFEAAERHELHRTAIIFFHRLEAMGGWVDDVGDWHDETRPIKPIDEASGADLSAGWEY